MRTTKTQRDAGKILPFSHYDFSAKPGDIMVDFEGNAFRLYEHPWRAELSPRKLKRQGMRAIIENEKLVWIPVVQFCSLNGIGQRKHPAPGQPEPEKERE
ncbi:MAG: hypothetical protein WC637_20935 [Victivallales bacterium]|jgi:hypothetical protein